MLRFLVEFLYLKFCVECVSPSTICYFKLKHNYLFYETVLNGSVVLVLLLAFFFYIKYKRNKERINFIPTLGKFAQTITIVYEPNHLTQLGASLSLLVFSWINVL